MIDLSDMNICAELHGKIDPDLAAEQPHFLGRWYNTARLAVELGGGYGDAIIIPLRDGKKGRKPYPKLYRHRSRTTGPTSARTSPTASRSRPRRAR